MKTLESDFGKFMLFLNTVMYNYVTGSTLCDIFFHIIRITDLL